MATQNDKPLVAAIISICFIMFLVGVLLGKITTERDCKRQVLNGKWSIQTNITTYVEVK